MMRASRMIAVFVAAIAAACAHHNSNTVTRGEPVGVNSVTTTSHDSPDTAK
jgi:hypothetical protein